MSRNKRFNIDLFCLLCITCCTALFPITDCDGVKIPFKFIYEVALQVPVLGVTVNCIGEPILHNGPIESILGVGGLSTDTLIVLLSGQTVVLGVELVL